MVNIKFIIDNILRIHFLIIAKKEFIF